MEAVAGPFVGALARFRDDVRVVARKEKGALQNAYERVHR